MTTYEIAVPLPRASVVARRAFNWERLLGRIGVHSTVIVLVILWIIPTLGVLVSSFRSQTDIASNGWWTVFQNPLDFTKYTLENYDAVINNPNYDMGRAFANSLIISIPATLAPVLLAAMAAYAFSWMRFPGRNALFFVLAEVLVIPLQLTFIPVLRIFNQLGITNNEYLPYLGIWIAHTGYALPYAIYLLRTYMGSLPKHVFEAAFLDGCTHRTAFLRLAMPLSIPALASLAVFQFLWVWNDLLVALTYMGGGRYAPLTHRLSTLVNSLGQDWHLLTAGAFVSMVLPLIVFLLLHRFVAYSALLSRR